MKKFVSILLLCLLTLCPCLANADYIYKIESSHKINDAITYEEKQLLTESGWIRAYIAYVDLSNPHAGIKVLTSDKGVSYLDTVRNMAKKEGATLAINGDFFNFASGQTNMLGMTYSEGELLSSPALDNMVSFVVTEQGNVIMDYFAHSSAVLSPQGYSCPIYQINKMPVTTGAITLLTPAWASHTPAKGFKVMVVENDKVSHIKEASSDGVPMPQNGYVLVTNPEINGFFDNFEIGDTVTVEIDITPDTEAIKEATGGNTLIVENGKIAPFTSNITGKAQRSSVGITKDGKTLILLATDGRTTACPGISQEELARLMIELGAERAINLDGGGSTTLTIKNPDGTYDIKNSLSSERQVSTAIGIISESLIGKYATHATLTPSQSVILEGDTVNFDAVFYDKYENVFAHNAASTKLYDQNGNPVQFSKYSPSVGKHIIYAELGGIVTSCEIEVIEELFAIDVGYEAIELGKGKAIQLQAFGYGPDGQKTLINPSLIDWISSSDNVKAENGKVTALSDDGAIITVKYENVMDFVNVNKAKTKMKAPPSVYGKDALYGSLDGKKVAMSGNVPAGATLLNRLFSIQRLEELTEYDKAYVTASYYSFDTPEAVTMANAFSKTKMDNTLFVTLNTSKGYVAKGSDWAKLGLALSEDAKNIVICAEFAPDQLGQSEQIPLKKMLESAKDAGKNVFYVSSGETTGMKIENSVRYITLGMVADYKTKNMASNAKTCQYVTFSVLGDEIRFEFK